MASWFLEMSANEERPKKRSINRTRECSAQIQDLSQFAHVASHDLRSPLNTVSLFIQLLERDYGAQLGDGRELLARNRGHKTHGEAD